MNKRASGFSLPILLGVIVLLGALGFLGYKYKDTLAMRFRGEKAAVAPIVPDIVTSTVTPSPMATPVASPIPTTKPVGTPLPSIAELTPGNATQASNSSLPRSGPELNLFLLSGGLTSGAGLFNYFRAKEKLKKSLEKIEIL